MSFRLGISPIGWCNDDLPELGDDIPLDTCLAEAREWPCVPDHAIDPNRLSPARLTMCDHNVTGVEARPTLHLMRRPIDKPMLGKHKRRYFHGVEISGLVTCCRGRVVHGFGHGDKKSVSNTWIGH